MRQSAQAPSSSQSYLSVQAGTPVYLAKDNEVLVDEQLRALKVNTTDAQLMGGEQQGAAIYLDSAVIRNGETIGYTVAEPYVVLSDRIIVSMSGQPHMRIAFRPLAATATALLPVRR